MIFPIFNMPCLHNHHQPPHNHHSRDFHDDKMSSSAAIGLAVGLTLIAAIIAALLYCLCWRQHDRHKKHRKQSSHQRENHSNHVTAETKQKQQRQDGSTQTEQVPPLPKMPLSIHHHQHDDKYFHGDHYHGHVHEGDHILDCPDHNDDLDVHGDSHHSRHGHHRHRHHRLHRTHQILLPRDPIAEFEGLISPLSPGIPDATRADLEAILNGLDIPLPNEPVRVNSRADVNVDQQGAARHEEESRERRKKKHYHHHHHRHRRCHRHKRVTVH
ncbi:hypothetical protein CFAM422_012471 [Trichoderma lentiforme]|uniref:Uncharacterized protein n=1 Tax=Trichoderma lentiforme TaxID=1567552 RepID=A0A9P4X4S1_9HYPO|nr:hypothetical protein CFAM422_012471 [Trichoderma lentiforme]